MTTTTATVEQRVQAGATWLDQHEPGWVDRIDLERLNVRSPECCVLGQMYSSYNRSGIGEQDSDCGFRAYAEDQDDFDDDAFVAAMVREYSELTAAWRQLIETRRAATDHGGTSYGTATFVFVLVIAAVLLVVFGNWG